MELTKQQIDGIFSQFSNPAFADEIGKQANALLPLVEDIESFRNAGAAFLQGAMKSVSLGGFDPKPISKIILVLLLLGMREFAPNTQPMLPEAELTSEEMERLRKEIDAIQRQPREGI